jgi:O-antigen/teichoic acid export membrane protein
VIDFLNSSRALTFSKIIASFLSLVWLGILTKNVSSDDLGTILECLFIGQSLIFLTDQGLTPSLILGRYSKNERERAVAHIVSAVQIRTKRLFLIAPLLIVLLNGLTAASWFAITAVLVSHAATAIYSTINTGLLASEIRYVETISESTSRLLCVALGTVVLLAQDGVASVQMILAIYAIADVFMLAFVVYSFLRIRGRNTNNIKEVLSINNSYRIQSTVSMGASSTIGVGESWALSVRSTQSDFAFYGLMMRVISVGGLVASYLGYSDRPLLIKWIYEKDWKSLRSRCQKLVILSLLPTGALVLLAIGGGFEIFKLEGYDLVANWIPITLMVISTPAVVLANYLTLTLQSVDPKSTTVVVMFTGVFNTVGVIVFYEVFAIAGVFVFLAAANFVKALLIFFFTKRKLQLI